MTFTKRLLAALVLVFVASVLQVSAHDEFRFVGTVVKTDTTKNVVSIKFKEAGKDVTLPIQLTVGTTITKDGQKATKTDLKVGLNVVVDALGDDDTNLEAVAIRIVPPPAK